MTSLIDLRNHLLAERETGQLTEIPRNLNEEAQTALQEHRGRIFSSSDPLSDETQIAIDEADGIDDLVEQIYTMRLRKITTLALTSDPKTNSEELRRMTPQERSVFDDIFNRVNRYRQQVRLPQAIPPPEPRSPPSPLPPSPAPTAPLSTPVSTPTPQPPTPAPAPQTPKPTPPPPPPVAKPSPPPASKPAPPKQPVQKPLVPPEQPKTPLAPAPKPATPPATPTQAPKPAPQPVEPKTGGQTTSPPATPGGAMKGVGPYGTPTPPPVPTQTITGGKPPDKMVVITNQDIEPFVGVDGRTYTLKKGSLEIVPRENAEALVARGVAKISGSVTKKA